MTAPNNQHLLTDFPTPQVLLDTRTGSQEIWEVDIEYLVAAGTDVEKLIADMFDGKTADLSVPVPVRGIYIKGFKKVHPEPSSVHEVTNPFLNSLFSGRLLSRVDNASELWNITTQYLVEAGTDVQQMLADSVQGKFNNNELKMSPACKAIVPISDIVKIK